MKYEASLMRLIKRLGMSLALLLSCTGTASADTSTGRVQATWLGGPTLMFRFGPLTLLTDPVLGASFRMIDPNSGTPDVSHQRVNPLPSADFQSTDLVLVSHDHPDHLDEKALAELSKKTFLAPPRQVSALEGRGVGQVLGLAWSEKHEIKKDGYSITITAVQAQHSQRPELLHILGDMNGYWIEFRRGKYGRTVYWTGDSFPVPSDSLKPYRAPDLFVPHLGGVGAGGPFGQVSMGARDAIAFARAVRPKAVLPIHHSTFSLYREPVDAFVKAAAGERWRTETLAEGETLILQ